MGLNGIRTRAASVGVALAACVPTFSCRRESFSDATSEATAALAPEEASNSKSPKQGVLNAPDVVVTADSTFKFWLPAGVQIVGGSVNITLPEAMAFEYNQLSLRWRQEQPQDSWQWVWTKLTTTGQKWFSEAGKIPNWECYVYDYEQTTENTTAIIANVPSALTLSVTWEKRAEGWIWKFTDSSTGTSSSIRADSVDYASEKLGELYPPDDEHGLVVEWYPSEGKSVGQLVLRDLTWQLSSANAQNCKLVLRGSGELGSVIVSDDMKSCQVDYLKLGNPT